VEAGVCGQRRTFPADYVLSTIPVANLARIVRTTSALPPEAAHGTLQHRAMVLVYLTMQTDRFTEFDAHYFPETSVCMSRLSEPKNYSLTEREGRTVLCAEVPCAQGDPEWSMGDDELRDLVCRDLERVGLGPLPHVVGVETRRLSHAYPLYTKGYREAFVVIDRWAGGITGLVTFGRQGLFAHDNTHHTMAMAYALVDCLAPDGTFDRACWTRARRSFEDHVVED
jgi:protoporphyrinogen oxidase